MRRNGERLSVKGIVSQPMPLSQCCTRYGRKPSSARVTKQEQLAMLDAWRKENDHPLSAAVVEAAKALIMGCDLSVARVLDLMSKVQNHLNQYQALNIVYFACDDVDGRADAKYEEIVSGWKDASAERKGKTRDKSNRAGQPPG